MLRKLSCMPEEEKRSKFILHYERFALSLHKTSCISATWDFEEMTLKVYGTKQREEPEIILLHKGGGRDIGRFGEYAALLGKGSAYAEA